MPHHSEAKAAVMNLRAKANAVASRARSTGNKKYYSAVLKRNLEQRAEDFLREQIQQRSKVEALE